MTDTNVPMAGDENWNEFVEEMNEQFLSALEENVETQATFVETWFDTLGESVDDNQEISDGLEGYARAYEAWMNAAQEQFERTSDALEGEDVDPADFRDIWLNTANDAFKEVMSTSAFAAATGKTVEEALEFRKEIDETAQDTLSELGFATSGDVTEIGERLVELERRQHEVERKLDRVLDHLEE